jgi:probable HAF family extracellular repeat protein
MTCLFMLSMLVALPGCSNGGPAGAPGADRGLVPGLDRGMDIGGATEGGTADQGLPDAGSGVSYTKLGTLGGTQSAAFGVNAAGQVVGWAQITGDQARHAFLWDQGKMTDLGLLTGDQESTARAINDNGLVVGTSERDIHAGSGTFHAFVYSNGKLTALPDLGGKQSWAADVNNAGTIVGYAYNAAGAEIAAFWKGGVPTNIGQHSKAGRQRVYGVNDQGVMVGWQYNAGSGSPNDAFRYDGKTWTIIGGQGGPWQNAEAYAINASGVAVGLSAFPSGNWRAAKWSAGASSATDCGKLPGFDYTELYDVNSAGVAVGRAYTDEPVKSRAVLYKAGKLLDLNSLMPAGSGVVLWEARGINDRGEIVGTAMGTAGFEAFIMVSDTPT